MKVLLLFMLRAYQYAIRPLMGLRPAASRGVIRIIRAGTTRFLEQGSRTSHFLTGSWIPNV